VDILQPYALMRNLMWHHHCHLPEGWELPSHRPSGRTRRSSHTFPEAALASPNE
jgi:hypothetical protein